MMIKAITILTLVAIMSTGCNSGSKPAPDSRNYESSYSSSSTQTSSKEDDPFINNTLSTGSVPYSCLGLSGDESKISIKTSKSANCDVVVLVKSEGLLVRNAYIKAGGSYTFDLPNGSYQVFFYGGRGWNPNKRMPNGFKGGFVANESYSKDEETNLDYQGLEYNLTPTQHGNFSTHQSDAEELF